MGNRKLADVIRRHFATVDFMGDLEEAVSDTLHGKFPNLLRGSAGLLNYDAIDRQFGNADVYDGSAISPTTDKIPGSRGFKD